MRYTKHLFVTVYCIMAEAKLLILFVLLFSVNISSSARYEYVTVDSSAGPIRGVKDLKDNYAMFLGIPYATVNYSNPFGESIPITKRFKETFNAIRDGNRCAQFGHLEDSIFYCSLDCLHLSIYKPNVLSDNIPVLIFINGNNYDTGICWRNLFGQQFLVKQDIIAVTMSFRLGIYGYLCLDTPEVPGNQGLKDQLKALKWVKRHIRSFGGDPDMITLFGHSSGAHNADFHLLYAKDPLFNQIILQGGNNYCPLIFTPSNRKVPIMVAKQLGFETTDFVEATKFLTESEPCDVVKATADLNIRLYNCVEKEFKNVERFVTDYPVNVAEIPNMNNMNVMLGHTEDEMAFSYVIGANRMFYQNMKETDYLKLIFNLNDEELTKLGAIIGQFYFRDTIHEERFKEDVYDMSSDVFAVHPTQRVMKKMFENGANKVYFSIFSYKGPLSDYCVKTMNKQLNEYVTVRRASHSEDLVYLMHFGVYKNVTHGDQHMINVMTTLWGNFVKYGDPTPHTSELLPIKWTPVTKDSKFIYMNITSNMSIHDEGLWRERIAFWDLIYDEFKNKRRHYNEV